MSEVFGFAYAQAYDALYQDKNYATECDLIEHVFRIHAGGPVHDVLDLGCGTGNHAIVLAERGYKVAGVDRSESMLAELKKKAGLSGIRGVSVHRGDIHQLDLQRKFDGVLMMFAVLGYQLSNADVLATLRTARHHLNPGGLLIFDVWYGPAVLHVRPAPQVKVVQTSDGKILRSAAGELDIDRHVCIVNYHVWRIEQERMAAETEERHEMRFFFPQELNLFLELSGFALARVGAFPQFERPPDESTWNILIAARAV